MNCPRKCFALIIICAVAALSAAAMWWLREPPPAPPAAPDGGRIKVATFNAQFLPGLARLFNKRADPEYRAARLAARLAGYDIVGLNEVFDARPREILLAGLRRHLGSQFHCVLPPADERSAFGIDSGLMIVSRLPVVEHHSLKFGNDSSPIKYGPLADGFAAKGVLHARIRCSRGATPGDFLDVFVTHLESHVPAIREAQYPMLADFVRQHSSPDHPALILGDMNTDGRRPAQDDPEAPYHRLVRTLSAARPAADLTDVWPALSPLPGGTNDPDGSDGGERIDYVFVSNPRSGVVLSPRTVRVDPFLDPAVRSLSDHSAVEAELYWPRRAEK